MFNSYAQPDNEATRQILETASQKINLALDQALAHAKTPLEARLIGDWLVRSADVTVCECVLHLAMVNRKAEKSANSAK